MGAKSSRTHYIGGGVTTTPASVGQALPFNKVSSSHMYLISKQMMQVLGTKKKDIGGKTKAMKQSMYGGTSRAGEGSSRPSTATAQGGVFGVLGT
jgi:hypothetical protein